MAVPDKSSFVIRSDRFDRRTYREVYDGSPRLQQMVAKGAEVSSLFSQLGQDVFSGLYKVAPRLLEEGELRPEARVNRKLMETTMQTQPWQRLRTSTVLDQGMAAVGSLSVMQTLIEELENSPELKEAIEQAQQAAEASRSAELSERAGDQGQAEQYRLQAESLAEQAVEKIKDNLSTVRNAVRRASQAGDDETQEALNLFQSWGVDDGVRQKMPVEKQLALLERLRGPDLRKLADLIGRYKEMTRGHMATKVGRPIGFVHGVTQGRDLSRLLPTEMARLAHPVTRFDFARRWTEERTFQYQLKDNTPLGKGPIIALLDTSGSTSTPTPWGYEIKHWIAACGLGIVERARLENRAAAVIHFAGGGTPLKAIEFAPGEQQDPEKFLEVASVWHGGGTDFCQPLNLAVELLHEAAYKDGDIVLISDGEFDGYRPDWLERFHQVKEQMKFRVIGVVIGRAPLTGIKRVADVVRRVEANDSGVAQILEDLG